MIGKGLLVFFFFFALCARNFGYNVSDFREMFHADKSTTCMNNFTNTCNL